MSITVKTDDRAQLEAFAKYLPLKPYEPSSLTTDELKDKIQNFCDKAKAHFERMKKISTEKLEKTVQNFLDSDCKIDTVASAREIVTLSDDLDDHFVFPAREVYAHCIMVVNGYGHLSSLAAIDWEKKWEEKGRITAL